MLKLLRWLAREWNAFRMDREYRAACVAFGRPLGPRGKRSIAFLVVVALSVVVWQETFAGPRAHLDDSFKVTAASGVHHDKDFVYFLYYLNVFPVASTAGPGDYSYDGARKVLNEEGNTLRQDLGWTWYAGDRGKIYLYLFDAWLKGAPWNPSPRPASRLLFIGALVGLLASAWWVRRPLLGVLLVLFLGSDPFQLYEVHGRDNVFGLSITTAILLLAIHLPLLQRWYRPHPRWIFVWPAVVGILMATIRTFRSEPMPMLIAPALTYLALRGLTLRRRFALVGVLAVAFWLNGAAWNQHFLRQHHEAAEVVLSHGGHPFPEDIRLYHHVWHPIWCGLGDFGEKYGYEWNDHAAAKYARPILQARGIYVPSSYIDLPQSDPRAYFDPDTKIYRRLPYDVPHYDEVIRDKILSDIARDPRWYLHVLLERVRRIFAMTTPVRITWAHGWLTVPWHAALFMPVAMFLVLARSRFLLRVLLFTLPTLATALFVYSDKGMTYYGIFHIVAVAVVATVVLEHATAFVQRAVAKRRAAAEAAPGE